MEDEKGQQRQSKEKRVVLQAGRDVVVSCDVMLNLLHRVAWFVVMAPTTKTTDARSIRLF